jgi:predicted DNA-binding helix-hairpin-helix protein
MNRFFDFSPSQLKFLAALSATALVMGGYLFLRSYAYPPDNPPALKVFIGIFVLDPNTAPADSLELLPGIGPVLADRIVEYRQQKRFEREVDITEVKGIGPKLYERLRPYLKIQHR